ncbi:MAG: hypothetical protein J6N72_07815 [Psychrobacter sp.]|nr:hypothetical protein [Psychrobacter sp.]
MKLIHVVHVQKFNKRHMPDQMHYVGEVKELAQQLAGHGCKEKFEFVQDLLNYLRKADNDKDFNLIHSYEAN